MYPALANTPARSVVRILEHKPTLLVLELSILTCGKMGSCQMMQDLSKQGQGVGRVGQTGKDEDGESRQTHRDS